MTSTCSVCLQGKKISTPTVWCPDCDDLLCRSCTKHHKRSKGTTNHQVVLYEDYQKLPPFILKIRPYCAEHNERFTDFCRAHDIPICMTCFKNTHRKCEDIPKIEDIIHNVKDSVLFEDTMLEMKVMCHTLRILAHDRKKNLKQLKDMYQEIKEDFENKSGQTVNHPMSFKDKTISKLDSVYDELITDLSTTRQTLKSKRRELRAILKQKEAIKENSSDYQVFIGVKIIEKILHETNIYLNEFSANDKFKEYCLTFDMSRAIDDIKSGIQSMGDISVIKGPSAVSIHTTKPRDLGAVKEVKTKSPVQLIIHQTINLNMDSAYKGCCTLPGGLLLFSSSRSPPNSNNKLILYKSDGLIRSIIKFENSEDIRDVTPVDEDHVAVSHPESHRISIINVNQGSNNEGKVVKRIPTGMYITGLCCRERDIVCCVPGRGLVKVNIDTCSEKLETVVEDESVGYLSYVQAGNNLMCYTCTNAHTVTVLDTQYNIISTFKSEAVMKGPSGVTIDDKGYIYVTGFYSHNLVVLSPYGDSCHQLLSDRDGLLNPSVIHYDKETKKLLVVSQRGGPALLYKVAKV